MINEYRLIYKRKKQNTKKQAETNGYGSLM